MPRMESVPNKDARLALGAVRVSVCTLLRPPRLPTITSTFRDAVSGGMSGAAPVCNRWDEITSRLLSIVKSRFVEGPIIETRQWMMRAILPETNRQQSDLHTLSFQKCREG